MYKNITISKCSKCLNVQKCSKGLKMFKMFKNVLRFSECSKWFRNPFGGCGVLGVAPGEVSRK